ncbi:hypothetical protein ACEPAI_1147 [Sanghuangporus weigelae]
MLVSRRRTRGRERKQLGLALRRGRRSQNSMSLSRRDEGNGASDGVVLDLTLVGDGISSAVYTVPVTVGSNNQPFNLQVDTGSSDLWIASKSCSSKPCTANKPRLYDSSSSSTRTNTEFYIQYLSGAVDGPIVWDTFTIGGYTIDNQALAAASNVVNESLSESFSGILGLALPLNSVIGKTIPPGTNSVPDGATVMSNLFGTQPADQAPAQFFYSVLLSRPNIDRIPSVLGIGRHPSNDLLSDGLTIEPERIEYSDVIPENNGVLFWKAELRGITVYVNGTAKEIDLGPSVTGNVFPEAVLDTGVPYIISTPHIANAVWGALGISPANDGNYYVPCTTPINMTITLDDRSEIPIHPLDLTAVPGSGGSTCTGLFQQSPFLTLPHGFGDIILGVPFLRNVYTVMAYKHVDANGVVGSSGDTPISPQLGLLNLTDPAIALDEFNTVRVLNKPLNGNNSQQSSSGGGLSIGLKVLFGLLGFIALCGALFAGRWLFLRRRNKQAQRAARDLGDQLNDKDAYALAKYHLAQFRSHSLDPSEDTQRTLADPTARLDAKYDSLKNVNGSGIEYGSFADEDLGFRRSKKFVDDGDGGEGEAGTDADAGNAHTGAERVALSDRPKIGEEGWEPHHSWVDSYSEYQPPLLGEWRPEPAHERSYSSSSVTSAHGPSPSSPLLEVRRSTALSPMPLETEVDEFGGLDMFGMAGVGSGRRRASMIDGDADADATLTNDREHPRQRQEHLQQQSHSQSFSDTTLHSRMSTASVGSLSGDSRYPPVRPRPRLGRTPSGPRTSSMMSRVINADDVS